MIFRISNHFLEIILNHQQETKKDFGRWAGFRPNGNSARCGDPLRWPSPRPNGKSAQDGVRPHYAVCNHCARGLSVGALVGKVWPGRCPWHLWRTGSVPGKERRRETHRGGVATVGQWNWLVRWHSNDNATAITGDLGRLQRHPWNRREVISSLIKRTFVECWVLIKRGKKRRLSVHFGLIPADPG
jgi:hypothetical protein